jgi:DNA-binding MarR family transcriptional regulator
LKLEQEIHQKKFKSREQKLAINLMYSSNWLNSHFHSLFSNADITLQQFNVLRILRGQYPKTCNVKLVKERMLDRMSDASRIIDKLYKKGLLSRQECPNDRRNVAILITQEGLELLKQLDEIDDKAADLFNTLTADEINLLNDLLDKMRG